jgi:hypothetical protein
VAMTPARIQTELGTWLWWVRPSLFVVHHGEEVEEVEAIGPTATVDPGPMIDGPWWGDAPWLTSGALSPVQLQYLAEAGYPPPLARVAVQALQRLLPRETCVELAREHETRMFIAPLYQTFVPFVMPLLALGCDLAEADLWDDPHLLKRLLIPSEQWGAATEVAVGAALKRAGLSVEREPRGRDEKRPEYAVHLDFWRYFIEVKTNPDSLAELRARQLEQGLGWLHGDLAELGRRVVIAGTEKLQKLLMDANLAPKESLGSQLRADLRRYLEGVKREGARVGRQAAGEYLNVVIADREDVDGSIGTTLALLPEVSDEKASYRIIRKIREAANQMPRAGRGIAVVEVGAARNLVALHAALHTAFASTPAAFEPIRALVFYVGEPIITGHRRRRLFGTPAPRVRLDPAEHKLVRALLLPRIEDGDIVEEHIHGTNESRLVEFTRPVPPGYPMSRRGGGGDVLSRLDNP